MPATEVVALLPWLTLRESVVPVGEVLFVRWNKHGLLPREIAPIRVNLRKIASLFKFFGNTSVESFTIVCLDGRADAWQIRNEDHGTIFRAVNFLFLAALAAQHLYDPLEPPINSTYFELHQRLVADFVQIVTRRRDGESWGIWSAKRSLMIAPTQVGPNDGIALDNDLLAALVTDDAAGGAILERLHLALPFLRLANTDSETMSRHAELVFAASAFEQMLGSNGKALDLSERIASLFKHYGAASAETAAITRPGITFAESDADAKHAEARKRWHVHQMWIYEMHKARSKAAHKGALTSRSWGWNELEHLVMASFVFPLIVKIILANASLYSLSVDDRIRCRAVDVLLSAIGWHEADAELSALAVWNGILVRAHRDAQHTELLAQFVDDLRTNSRTAR